MSNQMYITAADLVARPAAKVDWFMPGLLAPGTLGMVHAATGVGKTHFCTWMAICCACGVPFFKFQVPVPKRVLLVDGEMLTETLRRRILMIARGLNAEEPSNDYLRIVSPDLCGGIVPNIADVDERAAYRPLILNADIVIFDNLLSVARPTSAAEREEATWARIQAWLINLRTAGKAVIVVHHSNKFRTGQLGSSVKEHAMDWIINLKRPPDYTAQQGARFWVTFDKARHLFGEDPAPISVQLKSDDQKAWWEWAPLDKELDTSVKEMDAIGMHHRDISNALGVSLFYVKKILNNKMGVKNNGPTDKYW